MVKIDPIQPGESVVELWNRAFGGAFPLDGRLLLHNTTENPPFTLLAASDGTAVGFAVGRPGFVDALGVVPERRRQGVGSALLDALLDRMGPGPVRAGGGPAHFFPGIPDEFQACAAPLFERRGFRPDWTAVDLRRPGADPPPPDPRIRPCSAPDSLLAFLEREFPGRWLRDTRRRLEREPDPSSILVSTKEGRVVAFCHTFGPWDRVLGPSVFWRVLLSYPWGGLGPVGVAADCRGEGLGLGLVHTAIHSLAARGAADIVVDWTGVPDFYEKAGFTVWQRYRSWLRP
ncbi:MAG: GNAT family N-acetyltransferase [Candidatus Eremiobacterota bacterium]